MFQYISCYSLSFAKEILDIACKGFQYISCYSLSQPGIGIDYATGFQYISCYSLSSIHLTTTLISEVSIHLMLLFINNRNIMECKEICFNTSHVTLYRLWGARTGHCDICFNTSHVTLYRIGVSKIVRKLKFQYISCYSLSIAELLFWVISNRFNTSHVTLYQSKGNARHPSDVVSIHLMLLFITIENLDEKVDVCFNTSHVTLYLQQRTGSGIHLICFNTSHVTLYPREREGCVFRNVFQYISCYSLSKNIFGIYRSWIHVSIHLMLLFI